MSQRSRRAETQCRLGSSRLYSGERAFPKTLTDFDRGERAFPPMSQRSRRAEARCRLGRSRPYSGERAFPKTLTGFDRGERAFPGMSVVGSAAPSRARRAAGSCRRPTASSSASESTGRTTGLSPSARDAPRRRTGVRSSNRCSAPSTRRLPHSREARGHVLASAPPRERRTRARFAAAERARRRR